MQTLKIRFSKILSITATAGVFLMLLLTPVLSQASVSAQSCVPGSDGLSAGAACAKPDGVAEDLFGDDGLFKKVSNLLIFLIGAISVIMLIIGGFRYVVSGGDSAGVESAKNTILYAIVGLIVAFLAFAAVDFVIKGISSDGGVTS